MNSVTADVLYQMYLEDNKCVHHINFDIADNRIDNLRLMTKSKHMSYHSKLRWQNKKGSDDLSIQ